MIIVVTHFWIPTKIKKIKKKKEKKPQNSVDTIPPMCMPLPETLGVGSSADMGAAQAALAWCPLLPMRMLLPRSPFTQLQKGGEEFLKRRGLENQKRGTGKRERRQRGQATLKQQRGGPVLEGRQRAQFFEGER